MARFWYDVHALSLLVLRRYCGREHQVSDWKAHKARCKVIAADIAQAESHEIHKREFDRIRVKYGLDKDDKATEIAELLANTGANEGEFISCKLLHNEQMAAPHLGRDQLIHRRRVCAGVCSQIRHVGGGGGDFLGMD